MKKILSLAAVGIAAFLLITPTAFAAEFISGGDKDGNVTLSSTETHRNAYVAGSSIFVNSPITGDLYAAGGTITVESTVEQDLVVAGGTVVINGAVGGDVRVVGGEVTVNGAIAGDLVSAGGVVRVTEKGSIGGDAMIAGGEVDLNGAVTGNVTIRGGKALINTKVAGTVNVVTDDTLTFGSKADIMTKVSHKGPKDAVILEGGQVRDMSYTASETHKGNGAGRAIAGMFAVISLVKIIGTIIIGLILMKLFPRSTRELVNSFMDKPWVNLGIGFVGLFIAPFAVIVLLITIVGMYVAILAFLVWLVIIFIAAILACVFAGVWLLKAIKKTNVQPDWRALVLGTIALTVISIIPVVGALVFFVLMLMAFGSLVRHLYAYIQDEQHSVSNVIDVTPTDSTPSNPTIA